MSPERLAAALRMRAEESRTVDEIAAALGVSRATLYRHLDGAQNAPGDAAPRPDLRDY
jgi:predicted transcriptional regulator